MSASGGGGRRRASAFGTVGLVVGVLGILAALALPFAPVVTEKTTVTWPQAGRPAQSTTAFFVPYQPRDVHVRVPCEVVRDGQSRGTPTTLVSSDAPGKPSKGFTVSTADGSALVSLGGRQVYRGPIAGGDCGIALDAGTRGSSLHVGQRTIELPDDQVREVFAFATDLGPEQTSGLQVTAQTANWFENAPTPGKLALIGTALALMVSSLVLLVLGDRWRRRNAANDTGSPVTGSDEVASSDTETSDVRQPRGSWRAALRARWPLRLIDLGMLAILAVWAVLGPLSPDDSFTEGIIRNALSTGDFTNYYRWENSSEAPFTLLLHLLQPLVALHASPLVLRLPSTVAGLLTWLLLSRGVLPLVLPEQARSWRVRALLAAALLVWWLPFNLGVRPEPFIALGTTAVFACVLRATARPAGAGLTLLGVGALIGGLTVAVNPVGVTAVAPVLLLAPRIRRLLGIRRVPGARDESRLLPLAWCALGGCLAAVVLVAMFADQSWFGAQQATALHRFYGPDVGWFQEIRRYQYLLGFDDYQGGMARRLPVLLTLAVAGCATLLVVRGARRLPGMRMVPLPIGCLGIGLALLWLTPSKWTHYFGALAGFGGIALTAGIVLLAASARQWAERREVLLLGAAGTVAVIVAACLAFSGRNTYFLYSHFGVPFDELPLRPLNGPLPWLLLVAVLLAATLLPRFRGPLATRRMVGRMPAVVATAATASMVVVLLVSFAWAPIDRAGSYSVGGQMLAELGGGESDLVDHVVTTQDAPGGDLEAGGGDDELTGFEAGGGRASPPPAGTGPHEWGSSVDGALSTGSLTSRWFTAPPLAPGQELAVSASGRTGDGNHLALEFASSTGNGSTTSGSTTDRAPRVLGRQVLDDAYKERDKRPIYPSDHQIEEKPQENPDWRPLHVNRDQVPPGTDRVRVVAEDATTDPGGWLAVTGPRVVDTRPLRDFLGERGPVYVDWSMTWAAPHVRNAPRVADGLARAPTALVNPPESLGFDGRAAYADEIGGSFAGVDEVGQRNPVPTRLRGTRDEPKYADWGEVSEVTYPMARDAYDTRTAPETRWGWVGEGFEATLSTRKLTSD